MDALFFARVRHIGSASIYNNGVVWLNSVAATASLAQPPGLIAPRCIKAPRTGVSAQAPSWSSSGRGATDLRQLPLSGAKLEDTAPRGGQGRVAPGPALSPRWLHRHQPVATGRAGRRLLQQARDVRAMDQGRQGRHQVDAAVMLLVRRQRRASSASCAGLQSRQLHADTGPAGGNQTLVVDQPAGETREDRSKSGAPWPLRHIPDGRGRGTKGIVPGDSAADRGTTTTATTSACG